MSRGGNFVSWVLSVALLGGCSGQPSVRAAGPSPATPNGAARLQLVSIVDLAQPRGGASRWLRWLGGVNAVPRVVRRPYAVAWQGEDLLVVDPDARRVLRVLSSGKIRASSEGLAEVPIGLAACGDRVVVTDARAGTVLELDEGLRIRRVLAEGLARPSGVACANGEIFIAETAAHRIVILGGNGSRRTLGGRGMGSGEFNFPSALAASAGALWVGDTLNFRLQRFDIASGAFRGQFGQLGDAPGDLPRTKGIAVDAAGYLWVSDAHLDRVMLFTPEGELLTDVGGSGSAPGEFSFPAGLAAHPDGRVAVVDSLNRRIEIFRLTKGSPERGGR